MTSQTTWDALLAEQRDLRPQHMRQCLLAGYGQPLDDALWPVIDRLWALGIATSGSCQGHPLTDITYSNSYISVKDRISQHTRWQRVFLAILARPVTAGVSHYIETNAMNIAYSHRGLLPIQEKWQRGIQDWIDAIDHAAQASLNADELWAPWPGPCLDVPLDIDPAALFTMEWQHYLSELDTHSTQDRIVMEFGLLDSTLADVALRFGWPLSEVESGWRRGWAGWRERQAMAVTPLNYCPPE